MTARHLQPVQLRFDPVRAVAADQGFGIGQGAKYGGPAGGLGVWALSLINDDHRQQRVDGLKLEPELFSHGDEDRRTCGGWKGEIAWPRLVTQERP